MSDEYQTQNFWNMKHSELHKIIKEEVKKAILTDRIYDALSGVEEFNLLGMDQQGELVVQIEDMFKNLNENEFEKAIGKFKEKMEFKPSTAKNTMKPKEYTVDFWTMRKGDKDNDQVKVMATSEEEALKKAKDQSPKNSFSFKVKK